MVSAGAHSFFAVACSWAWLMLLLEAGKRLDHADCQDVGFPMEASMVTSDQSARSLGLHRQGSREALAAAWDVRAGSLPPGTDVLQETPQGQRLRCFWRLFRSTPAFVGPARVQFPTRQCRSF